MQKQVDKKHYTFSSYMEKDRWNSVYHQIDEVIKINPDSILEIGVGTGILEAILKHLDFTYESLDIAEDLNPTHVGSILQMPFKDHTYDAVCCFQVLELLPYENFESALKEIFRVAKRRVAISLPNAGYVTKIKLPRFKEFIIEKNWKKKRKITFNGEHYWEINRQGYPLSRIMSSINNVISNDWVLETKYRPFEMSYHHFFVFNRL